MTGPSAQGGLTRPCGRHLEHVRRVPRGNWPLGDLHGGGGEDRQGARSQRTHTSGRFKLEKICLMMLYSRLFWLPQR